MAVDDMQGEKLKGRRQRGTLFHNSVMEIIFFFGDRSTVIVSCEFGVVIGCARQENILRSPPHACVKTENAVVLALVPLGNTKTAIKSINGNFIFIKGELHLHNI